MSQPLQQTIEQAWENRASLSPQSHPREVAEGISRVDGVPGRLEPVVQGQDYTVVVDYAHKPDALEVCSGTRTFCPIMSSS